ncbi:OsmC family protein [Tropicimonas sp. IMCC6043]|uniref:OsmC family protein n=1 Tax=Tropicimonas sp. IMCC6043 TaxID=2510645 RepID=UPI00101C3D85|nr:OsmC family protein [Tropicimonas sp. IMCC6043]RYH10812.1 OsmC family peroxiredoxin [Tropicimonas sp. IMCC6043]
MSGLPMNYTTSYRWSGEAELGTSGAEGRSDLPLAGPHVGDRYNPELFLVMAAESCLANSLFAVAGMSQLEIRGYSSEAEGELELEKGKGYRFKRITIHPVVTVEAGKEERAAKLLDKAHAICLVSRSLNCPVEMEPEILAG